MLQSSLFSFFPLVPDLQKIRNIGKMHIGFHFWEKKRAGISFLIDVSSFYVKSQLHMS